MCVQRVHQAGAIWNAGRLCKPCLAKERQPSTCHPCLFVQAIRYRSRLRLTWIGNLHLPSDETTMSRDTAACPYHSQWSHYDEALRRLSRNGGHWCQRKWERHRACRKQKDPKAGGLSQVHQGSTRSIGIPTCSILKAQGRIGWKSMHCPILLLGIAAQQWKWSSGLDCCRGSGCSGVCPGSTGSLARGAMAPRCPGMPGCQCGCSSIWKAFVQWAARAAGHSHRHSCKCAGKSRVNCWVLASVLPDVLLVSIGSRSCTCIAYRILTSYGSQEEQEYNPRSWQEIPFSFSVFSPCFSRTTRSDKIRGVSPKPLQLLQAQPITVLAFRNGPYNMRPRLLQILLTENKHVSVCWRSHAKWQVFSIDKHQGKHQAEDA